MYCSLLLSVGGGLGGPLRVSCYLAHSLFPSRTSQGAMGVLFLRQCRISIGVDSLQRNPETMPFPQGWRGRHVERRRIEDVGRGKYLVYRGRKLVRATQRGRGGMVGRYLPRMERPPSPRGFRSTATPLPLTSAHLELARPHFSSCRWDCELWSTLSVLVPPRVGTPRGQVSRPYQPRLISTILH